MNSVYDGEFHTLEDVIQAFDLPAKDSEALKQAEIAYAGYDCGDYDGAAFVLFRHEGKWWEANGRHCSCYGLEGQWAPEETFLQAVAQRRWAWPKLREALGRLMEVEEVEDDD